MNIPSYVVTFPATTARKLFFWTPTGPTQPSLFRYVDSRSVLEGEKSPHNKIIHFHLKITMFYSREKIELLAWENKPYVSSILRIKLFQHSKL